MKKRIAILAALFVTGAALAYLLQPESSMPAPDAELHAQIESAIINTLVKHRLDTRASKPRRIRSGDAKFFRVERRVTVPPEFSTLEFNHDLRNALEPAGASVVATERSETKTVAMHVKSGGVIVQSVIFVIRSEEQ